MPSGIASLPYRLRTAEAESPVRMLSRSRFAALRADRLLARGDDREDRPFLASRARQLVDPVGRERLAGAIERLLALADDNPRQLVGPAGAPFRAERVTGNQALFRQISEILRRSEAPSVRGIAMTSVLLFDNTSPLYANDTAEDLGDVLVGIGAMLER